MKFKNLIKITSILVFSIIVVACSDGGYNSNIDESQEDEVVESSGNQDIPSEVDETDKNQKICPVHNIQMDDSGDGIPYCGYCNAESESNYGEESEATQAEIQSQQEKTYKCKWCGINFYSPGYSFNYSTTRNQCDIDEHESYNCIYCSRKCANEACWSEH